MQSQQSKNSSKAKKDFKICLVLNSGGARAFFQIGILAAFENKIAFDVIVGTGIGAYIGSVIASGNPVSKIEDIARSLNPQDFICPSNNDCCFFSNDPLIERLEKIIGSPQIQQFRKKFIAVTTDFEANQTVIIDKDLILEAVNASITVPGFHLPYMKNSRGLADGSIVNPLPINVAWDNGADFIIAIDTVSQHLRPFNENCEDLSFWVKNAQTAFPQLWLLHKNKIPWLEMRMMETCYTYAVDEIIDAHKPEVLIQLEENGGLAREAFMDNFDKINRLIDLGKAHGKKILPQVLEKINSV